LPVMLLRCGATMVAAAALADGGANWFFKCFFEILCWGPHLALSTALLSARGTTLGKGVFAEYMHPEWVVLGVSCPSPSVSSTRHIWAFL
jgi:hypothetical protein